MIALGFGFLANPFRRFDFRQPLGSAKLSQIFQRFVQTYLGKSFSFTTDHQYSGIDAHKRTSILVRLPVARLYRRYGNGESRPPLPRQADDDPAATARSGAIRFRHPCTSPTRFPNGGLTARTGAPDPARRPGFHPSTRSYSSYRHINCADGACITLASNSSR
jgi:hypothetical protein